MYLCSIVFFFNDTATTEIYTLSLHDALPIFTGITAAVVGVIANLALYFALHTLFGETFRVTWGPVDLELPELGTLRPTRSEEHTSELQSRQYLVCRLLLEKKKKKNIIES